MLKLFGAIKSHFSVNVGSVSVGGCKVERMETGAGDWLLCPLTGLWGESRRRPSGDTMEVYGGHTGRQTVQRVL